jgi:hypothetical protein
VIGMPSDGAPRLGGATPRRKSALQPVPAAAFTNSERRLLDHLTGRTVIYDFVNKYRSQLALIFFFYPPSLEREPPNTKE